MSESKVCYVITSMLNQAVLAEYLAENCEYIGDSNGKTNMKMFAKNRLAQAERIINRECEIFFPE